MINIHSQFGIHSTAGAVPVRNEKGELSMKKVKVQRYVSGKRPEYAQSETSEEESETDDFIDNKKQLSSEDALQEQEEIPETIDDQDPDDPRLRRLTARKNDVAFTEERGERRRHIAEPETVEILERRPIRLDSGSDRGGSTDEEDLSDDEIERRRRALRERMLAKRRAEEEAAAAAEAAEKDSSGSSSESYEEYTTDESDDDEENETGPRLKPVFVSRKDRVTLIEREKEAQKQKQLEQEAKRHAEERKRQTLRMVEESIRKDIQESKNSTTDPRLEDVNTDDDNDELEFEAWKLRELKRIKRDREERERMFLEKQEVERIRSLTEEERRQELRAKPKVITNKAVKGKYKFLQKYYHRGAFYLDEEDAVYKQDFSGATLDDHFDKTVLPKVMQVKNFGRSGRTKYTHLVDQDTTQFDSPWITDTAQSMKFVNNQAAGMKQIFEKPSMKKKHS
ncbi:microfibrillar-associated protein 1-like [Ctenocephalides felis]|uniref:microfibrillar-associated protein 1-like n=1 Tax=Ctenocephalides felis TaxID=7515 RepID=UPI000E6E561E|nr:microfibrillar-associated protein 1-like [Ctenocephalides felis]